MGHAYRAPGQPSHDALTVAGTASRAGPRPVSQAVLDLQRRIGNQATVRELGLEASVQRAPNRTPIDPFADYAFLRRALTPQQQEALAAPGGRVSLPLVQLLPPALEYLTREQIIATVYPRMASVSVPAANVADLIAQVTESETLRAFLTPKLRSPVSIVANLDSTFSFSIYGQQIPSDQGMISLAALDRV